MMRWPRAVRSFERPEIDFLVAGGRALDRRAGLGKRRRIQHDRVESLAADLELPQFVEHVRFPQLEVRDAVSVAFSA